MYFQRLFPDCVIINNKNVSLSTIDILWLNGVSLHGFTVYLKVVPLYLMVTNNNNNNNNVPVSSEWKKSTWNMPHLRWEEAPRVNINCIHYIKTFLLSTSYFFFACVTFW